MIICLFADLVQKFWENCVHNRDTAGIQKEYSGDETFDYIKYTTEMKSACRILFGKSEREKKLLGDVASEYSY